MKNGVVKGSRGGGAVIGTLAFQANSRLGWLRPAPKYVVFRQSTVVHRSNACQH